MAKSKTQSKTSQKLTALKSILQKDKNMLIVMQDYPDPDAIAAACGLRVLANNIAGVSCTLAYGGGIGRAENRMLAKYTGLNLWRIENLDVEKFKLISMVDTQPATGNNSLDREIMPDIVIDHHPVRKHTQKAPFTDIRSRYGATCTIVYEYIKENGLEADTNLATTLLYGIRSDTQDLGREATKADIEAYLELYPTANKRMLSRIEHATVPRSYFENIASALVKARIYGPGIISTLGDLEHPDVLGEIADLLLRNEESSIALCHGVHDGRLILSLRATAPDTDAGTMMHHLVGKLGTGGGHSTLAGGQIPLDETKKNHQRQRVEQEVLRRFIKLIKTEQSNPELLVSPSTL